MIRPIATLLCTFALAAATATAALAQPTAGDNNVPATDSGPLLTIDSATVDGHQVQIHVSLQGATLAQTPDPGMDMSQMPGMDTSGGMSMSGGAGTSGGMDMSGMSMPMDQSAMANGAPGGSHLHVYVDGTMLVMSTQPDITLSDVPSGSHEVRVELSDSQHQPYNPPVQATTTILVP